MPSSLPAGFTKIPRADYGGTLKAANQDKGFGQNFLESVPLGFKKAGAGTMELGLNLAKALGAETVGGTDIQTMKDLLAEQQQEYTARGQGTGVGGFIGEVAGDPRTYLPIKGGSFRNAAVSGARTGAFTGATTGTGNAQSDLGANAQNAALFSGLGAVTSVAANTIARPFGNKTTARERELQKVLQDEGVSLTPAQKTGNKLLRGVEAGFKDLPLTQNTANEQSRKQLQQFTKAALAKAGVNAEDAAPDTLEAAAGEFTKRYTDITSRNAIKVDQELLDKLAEVETASMKRLGPDGTKVIRSYIDDISGTGASSSPAATIAGDVYQSTRSALGRLSTSADPEIRHLAGTLKRAFDDAAGRSVSKADKAAWDLLNKQYGAFKTIQKAMGSASDEAVKNGLVSPPALLQAVKSGNPRFALGAGELNKLARAGKALLADAIPRSGTPERQATQKLLTGQGLLTGGSATAGGGVGFLAGGPIGAAIGAGAGAIGSLVLPKIIQGAAGTKVGQAYLSKGLPQAIPSLVTGATESAASHMSADTAPQNITAPVSSLPPGFTKLPRQPAAQLPPPAPQSNLNPAIEKMGLRSQEGEKAQAYDDTTGNRTIGIGFNMDSPNAPDVWKKAGIATPFKEAYAGRAQLAPEEITNLANTSFDIAMKDVRAVVPQVDKMPENVRAGLMHLSYQVGGPRLKKFKNTLAAIKRGDMNAAVAALKASQLARQTPNRAQYIAQLLQQGG